MGKSMQAHFRRRRFYCLQVEGAGHRWSESPFREARGGHGSARRIPMEEDEYRDLIRHTLLLCGADAPRAPRGNMANSEVRERQRHDGNKQMKHSFAKTAARMEGQAAKCLQTSKTQTRIGAVCVTDQGLQWVNVACS